MSLAFNPTAFLTRLLMAFSCALALAGPVSAQGGLATHGFSPEQTQRVVASLKSGFRLCSEVPEVYRPDCTKFIMRRAAKRIGNVPAYWEAEVALSRVARHLDAMVREHGDAEASSLRQGGYRMKAVRGDVLLALRDVANDSFRTALGHLRSGTSSEVQFFAPIADVIERNRVWP